MPEGTPIADVSSMDREAKRELRRQLQRELRRVAKGRTLHAPDFPLLLLFTEKAGCTSLTKWFLFHIGKLDEALRVDPWVHVYRRNVLGAQPGYERDAWLRLISGAKTRVKLVRNPYTRAVSSFLHVLSTADEQKLIGTRMGEVIAAARALAGKAPETPALSFRDFVRYLAATGTERGRIDGHIARQHGAGEDGRIDRLIKLERFAEEIRRIEAECGLAPAPLELVTRSGHHRTATDRVSGGPDMEFTTAQVVGGHLPDYDTLYDAETRRLVSECFAADFEAYGYDA